MAQFTLPALILVNCMGSKPVDLIYEYGWFVDQLALKPERSAGTFAERVGEY